MRTRVKILFLIIAVISALLGWICINGGKNAKYRDLASKDTEFLSIAFNGQQRDVLFENAAVLTDFKRAFDGGKTNSLDSGILNQVTVTVKSGKVRSDIYINTNATGFTIADYSQMSAGDPRYATYRFPTPISKDTRDLIAFLLDQ